MRPRTTRRRASIALLAGAVTVAGMIVAATTPAQAAPPASAAKAAEAHYTPAGCNTARHPDVGGKLFAQCFAMIRTALAGQVAADADAPPATALSPAQIQDAYDLPADAGQGQTVAIVDALGDSQAEADLGIFRSQFGLSPCTTANGCFQKVDQNGGTDYPPDDAGWALETSLDLDAVSAACPNCHILLVEGSDESFDSLGTAVDTAVSMGAKFVSNSYGSRGGENPAETDYDHYYDHPGVAVTASTGDVGNVSSWPAANPNVVGVGGTKLTQDGSPRGWHESAWTGGGSGCSPYEPHPDYQTGIDTNCPDNRATADVSADADPDTGLAVYDSIPFQGESGWFQVGGTSLSSPLVAAMYALAGTPVPDTYPVTYPYARTPLLNDVTEGTNGGCGNVLCEAGPGWDGPTGLGTPNGVQALTLGVHGDIAGQVTESGTGQPVSGATVATAEGFTATTDAGGHYDLALPVGTYDVTASQFGYRSKTSSGVAVTDGQTTTLDVALVKVATHTLSGTVTDGSGHAWPLYAKITIDGVPGGALYTDPYTGHYSVDLPQGGDYALRVTPVAQGYVPKDLTVHLGSADKVANAKVLVDQSTCAAPGYAYEFNGTTEAFAGWTGTTTQDGWTNVDNAGIGQDWQFDNPGDRDVPPGGDADFAILDSDHYGSGNSQDASLVSPVADLTGQTTPDIGFDTYYNEFFNSTADVDLSIDGGQTWANVWRQTTTSVQGHVDIPIPQAAGQPAVQVRFHYTGSFAWWWELDNVFVGNRACAPQHGGLVAGVVHDDNTGDPINGAKVASEAVPGEFGVSAATPDDANLSDGFYWMFSSQTGSRSFTTTDGKYTPAAAAVNVAANFVTRQGWTLEAGHLALTPGGVAVTERLGAARSRNVTFTNDGTRLVHVEIGEQNGGFTPMGATRPAAQMPGAPRHVVKLDKPASDRSLLAQAKPGRKASAPADVATPAAAPWTSIADYPQAVVDNTAAYGDGIVYSVGGFNGSADLATGYAYDPSTQAWTSIADAPVTSEQAKAAYVNGTLYLIGGWASSGEPRTSAFAYDPSADSWSQVADMPLGVSAAGVAVLDGKIYIVGGCTDNCAPSSTKTQVYDPASDSWTEVADYPTPVTFVSCAGVAGEVVCAGGLDADTSQSLTSAYVYDPGSDSWSQGADMPIPLWGAAYSAGANDKLQVATGTTGTAETNQAFEYDPSADSWAALPNANNTLFRGAGACGMYQIGGGNAGIFSVTPHPFSEVLPGYDQCGKSDVPWLSESTSEFDLAPGASTTVAVTMDSSTVPQPGAYSARLAISTDTPYRFAPLPVAMQVNPPRTWGKITGTVSDAAGGSGVAGATVQIGTFGGTGQVTFTLRTGTSGHYQLWLDARYSPLQIIAAKDGYQPQVRTVKIKKRTTVTSNFALKKS